MKKQKEQKEKFKESKKTIALAKALQEYKSDKTYTPTKEVLEIKQKKYEQSRNLDKNLYNSAQRSEKISSKTEKIIMSLGKLGKPKAKLPSHSPKQFLRSLTSEHQALVRQVPERQFEEPRSLFFKEEFIKEKRRSGFL